MTTVSGVGVLFDLDDTLVDHAGAARDAILGCARRWGIRGDDDVVVERWRGLEQHFYRRFQAGELTLQGQRRARIRAFLHGVDVGVDLGVGDVADQVFDQFWSAYRRCWRAFADAPVALEAARTAGLAVGVLTNGERAHQLAKWTETRLIRPDVTLIASSELPAAKPSAAAYGAACALLGVPAGHGTTMVGDSWANDVEGARCAGLDAVHLDRSQDEDCSGLVPRVRSLDTIAFRLSRPVR